MVCEEVSPINLTVYLSMITFPGNGVPSREQLRLQIRRWSDCVRETCLWPPPWATRGKLPRNDNGDDKGLQYVRHYETSRQATVTLQYICSSSLHQPTAILLS
jgi:hypothetical protein